VITVSQGYTYAGGLELFCHGHIRIAEPQATFSVACRRWGVPLVDGGTVYLPRLLGWGAALPLILTGERISAERAHQIALVWELAEKGAGLARAMSNCVPGGVRIACDGRDRARRSSDCHGVRPTGIRSLGGMRTPLVRRNPGCRQNLEWRRARAGAFFANVDAETQQRIGRPKAAVCSRCSLYRRALCDALFAFLKSVRIHPGCDRSCTCSK
jgi:hypothetical protein